jgi:S-DNA-T family DNA segregation ATPase FtsK/SpoIIIE
MLTAGWNALNAPGKFLISAADHDTPRRARAYLLTDQAVTDTAARHADLRPSLDPVSTSALGTYSENEPADLDDDPDGPGTLLWAALSIAPEQGVSVADLVAATGRSHRWVNYRLRALAESGQVIQVKRGTWRAADRGSDVP